MSDLPPAAIKPRISNLKVVKPPPKRKAKRAPNKRRLIEKARKPESRKTASFQVKRIQSLVCFEDVHRMVLENWPLVEIARFIQKTKGELTTLTEQSLKVYLTIYRQWLPPGPMVRPLASVFHHAARKVAEGLDVISELERLYEIQMERIQIDFSREKELKKLMPTMTSEIRCGREILESLAKTKVEFGLDPKQMGLGAGEAAQKYGNDSVQKVLDNAPSRQKLLSLAARFVTVVKAREQMEVVEAQGGEVDGNPD